ncbi:glucosyltransferase GtrII-like protein [Albidovulum inexpectatum]|uniref:Glucosyltransferase GtrII-like protein n=1 Tax=Albidovulum inexpectatum TaxID=196587 RepID=A0A2S5JDY2_9RHOB|nr:glucosyltransferase domain-containing protein [Albidovulum inexpectatum]PPB79724.1 glucosyltransferase GtrII-like protein [Albidovulum inexpectatum]
MTGHVADPRGQPPRWRTALLTALALYGVTAAAGILADGHHSDDWRHMAGASDLWVAVEGRWLLDAIFRFVLGERFLLPMQIALAFPCLWGFSTIIARHAASPTMRPIATLAIFAVGTNHLFLADALSFASSVFAYPLALVLSAAGYDLITRQARTPIRRFAQLLVSAQLIAASIGIYQTYAVAGLIVPTVVLIRSDRHSFPAALRVAALGAAVSVAAIAVYLVEWRTYAAVMDMTIESRRFQPVTLDGLFEKLREYPALIKSLHTGSIMQIPRPVRMAMGLFAAFSILMPILGAAVMRGRQGPALNILRSAIGAGLAMFIFPTLFWLFYAGDAAPARAFGFIGFWSASLVISGLSLLEDRTLRVLRPGQAIVGAAVTAMAMLNAFVVSAFWSDSAHLGQRDEELARAIHARLAATQGYDGTFRLAGGIQDRSFSWGTLAGWTSFHAGNPSIGLFREMFGLEGSFAALPVSPRACHGFPAAGSVFRHEGKTYVCLQDLPAYTDDMRCADIDNMPGDRICLADRAIIHVSMTCLTRSVGNGDLNFAFLYRDSSHRALRRFSTANFPVLMHDECHTIALAPPTRNLDAIELWMQTPDGGAAWRERIDIKAFRATP